MFAHPIHHKFQLWLHVPWLLFAIVHISSPGCVPINYEDEPVYNLKAIEVRDVDDNLISGPLVDAICLETQGQRICASRVQGVFIIGVDEDDLEYAEMALGEPGGNCTNGRGVEAVHLGDNGILQLAFESSIFLYEGDEVHVYVLTDNGAWCPLIKYQIYIIDQNNQRHYLCRNIRSTICKVGAAP